jgi:hypothetical protein
VEVLGMRRRAIAFCLIALALGSGLLLVPGAGGVQAAFEARPVGEAFGAPYSAGFTGKTCSNQLSCSHELRADAGSGLMVAETRAAPNPGSVFGTGFASGWSQVQAWLFSYLDVPALRITAEVRVLAGSTVSAERPSTPAEVGASLSAWRNGCDACSAFTYSSVLTASSIDSRPSTLAEDLPLTLVVELRSKDGKPMRPGSFVVAPMAYTHVGHTNLPTVGKVEARAAIVVDRISTEILPT